MSMSMSMSNVKCQKRPVPWMRCAQSMVGGCSERTVVVSGGARDGEKVWR